MPTRRLPVMGVAAATLALGACATSDGAVDGAFYPAGFTDGCRTAEARQSSFSTEEHRNASLFKTEASYRAGWRSGYHHCKRTQDYTARPSDLGESNPSF